MVSSKHIGSSQTIYHLRGSGRIQLMEAILQSLDWYSFDSLLFDRELIPEFSKIVKKKLGIYS